MSEENEAGNAQIVHWPGANYTEQVAYDSGHGRRDRSHHPDNRYANPKLRAAYDRGFDDRNSQIEKMP
ncbi:hypothetical protein ASE67_02730 [Sphingomonas sp. Leaf23]|uniref:hypothetical protein n=1 Tax=Sphingomonas sp. Leaf23 TaxID=1735689 RepID=UPI0006FAA015|nr:hypothetical protein [Sphingomonas sp. Leaf23]KQM88675.1 hypothetical protein ASE67_02730 [Sphingomonas sp. Leaf23]